MSTNFSTVNFNNRKTNAEINGGKLRPHLATPARRAEQGPHLHEMVPVFKAGAASGAGLEASLDMNHIFSGILMLSVSFWFVSMGVRNLRRK